MPLAACSTHQTLPGLVDWDTDRLSLLDSYWQGKIETTTMHQHAHTHTQICQCAHTDSHSVKLELSTLLPSLETVYYMCKPLMQWWVLMPPDKKHPKLNMKETPPPEGWRKKERDYLLKISYTSYTKAHAFIWKRRTEYGARAPPPNSPPASF